MVYFKSSVVNEQWIVAELTHPVHVPSVAGYSRSESPGRIQTRSGVFDLMEQAFDRLDIETRCI